MVLLGYAGRFEGVTLVALERAVGGDPLRPGLPAGLDEAGLDGFGTAEEHLVRVAPRNAEWGMTALCCST